MKQITRQEAQRLNLQFYYTGRACSNGHKARRYTGTGKCEICVSQAKEAPKRVTRAFAIKNNYRYYFEGETCENGHTSHRFTDTGECTLCAITPPMEEDRALALKYQEAVFQLMVPQTVDPFDEDD